MMYYRGIDLTDIEDVIDKNVLAAIRWQYGEGNLFNSHDITEKRAVAVMYEEDHLCITYIITVEDDDGNEEERNVEYKYLLDYMNGVLTCVEYECIKDFAL